MLQNIIAREQFFSQQHRLCWYRDVQCHHSLMRRLEVHSILEKHTGCINTINYQPGTGALLASGGDDTQICLWDYPSHSLRHCFRTGHTANIFCVKWMDDDRILITCAGDDEIRVHRAATGQLIKVFDNHTDRVKKLATLPSTPHAFLSCSEDSTVRSFDLRSGMNGDVVTTLFGDEIDLNSISVNEVADQYFAVGGGDSVVRLFDRRFIPNSSYRYGSPWLFSASHARGRSNDHHITAVKFNDYSGTELLANYSNSHVYLFDTSRFVGGLSVSGVGMNKPASMGYSTHHRSSKRRRRNRCIVNWMSGKEVDNSSAGSDSEVINISTHEPVITAKRCCELASNGDIEEAVTESKKVLSQCRYSSLDDDIVGDLQQRTFVLRARCFAILADKSKSKSFYMQSLLSCRRAILQDPKDTLPHFVRAQVLAQLGRFPEAINAARMVSQNDMLDSADSKSEESPLVVEGENDGEDYGVVMRRTKLLLSAVEDVITNAKKKDSEVDDCDYENPELLLLRVDDAARALQHSDLPFSLSPRLRNGIRFVNSLKPNDHGSGNNSGNDDHQEVVAPDNVDTMSDGEVSDVEDPDDSVVKGPLYQEESAYYRGALNIRTVKDVNFLGPRCEYIASGSDCGNLFIWDKNTKEIIRMVKGDGDIVNCVAQHPLDTTIAVSGIDNTVKICAPVADIPNNGDEIVKQVNLNGSNRTQRSPGMFISRRMYLQFLNAMARQQDASGNEDGEANGDIPGACIQQ